MTASWPFAQWGLDIIGPFLVAARQLKFLIVGIDYFTKWVEAEALATITEKNVRSFVWRHIIYRYEIPKVLVSDYEKQFNNDSFKDFCSQLGIKNHYSSPAHPQAKGLVEITNQSLLKLSRLDSRGQRVYGPKSFQACYGILDNGQNTYRGNTVSASIWERGGYSSRGRAHKLQGGQPR